METLYTCIMGAHRWTDTVCRDSWLSGNVCCLGPQGWAYEMEVPMWAIWPIWAIWAHMNPYRVHNRCPGQRLVVPLMKGFGWCMDEGVCWMKGFVGWRGMWLSPLLPQCCLGSLADLFTLLKGVCIQLCPTWISSQECLICSVLVVGLMGLMPFCQISLTWSWWAQGHCCAGAWWAEGHCSRMMCHWSLSTG